MAQQGDDCYFFYYSSCSKGDACPFRHCAAALGNETVCSLWQEGRCRRQVCKFRHMDIKKDRSKIPCYWEQQPGGCRKPHCVFMHTGGQLDSSGDVNMQLIVTSPEPILDPQVKEAGRLDMVKRRSIEAPESSDTPSPKVAPVVVNFEDEDTEPDSPGNTPIKQPPRLELIKPPGQPKIVSLQKQGDDNAESNLNFGVKSLEEIRKEKLSKAKMLLAKADSVLEQSSSGESSVPTRTVDSVLAGEENRRIIHMSEETNEVAPPSKSVMQRLGRKIQAWPSSKDNQENAVSEMGKRELRVKTLAEIRQEKLQKEQELKRRLSKNSGDTAEKQRVTLVTQRLQPREERDVKIHVKSLTEIQQMKSRAQIRSLLAETAEDEVETVPKKIKLSPRRPPKQERQIYMPPVVAQQKRKITIQPAAPDPEERTTQARGKGDGDPSNTTKKKTIGWGVKTFSEIMHEKRMRQKQAEQSSADSSSTSRVSPKQKRAISPIAFDKDVENDNQSHSSAKQPKMAASSEVSESGRSNVPASRWATAVANRRTQPKKAIKPIVFDLDKSEDRGSSKLGKQANAQPSTGFNDTVVSRRRISPVIFEAEKEETSSQRNDVHTSTDRIPEKVISPHKTTELADAAPVISSSRSLSLQITTSQPTAGNKKVISSPPGAHNTVTSPRSVLSPTHRAPLARAVQQRTISSTSDDGEKTVPTRRTSSRSISREGKLSPKGVVPETHRRTSVSTSKKVAVTDDDVDDSFLEEELDDILGDLGDMPAGSNNQPAQDEDDFLQEMEELLA